MGNREAGVNEFGTRLRGTSIAIAIGALADAAIVVVDQTHKRLEIWEKGGRVGDPSASIRDAFVTLVEAYGVPAPGSPVIDAADPAMAATEDILGRQRGSRPDLGAWERPEPDDTVFEDGFEVR